MFFFYFRFVYGAIIDLIRMESVYTNPTTKYRHE